MQELAYGSKGPDVLQLQKNLNKLGFNCGPEDGVFFSKTLGAVKRYQQARGLKVDGIAGPKTQTSIFQDISNASNSSAIIRPVKDIQTALKAKGFDPGPIDGDYGPRTTSAVKAFQEANGLVPDGIAGPITCGVLFATPQPPQQQPAPAPTSQPTKKIKVAVRQGHGGSDPGAVSGQFIEKDMNEVAARRLFNDLTQKGFDCLYISGSDLNAGIQQANDWGADIFVSVHHNAGKGDGYEVIHTINPNSPGVKLAILIAEEFKGLGQNAHGQGVISKRGKNGDYYGEIRDALMPAVITEFAYIDSSDVSIVDTTPELEAEGDATYRAICKFYGV